MGLRSCVYVWHIRCVIGLTHTEGFQWDAGNDRKSADKHDANQSEAELVFFSQSLLVVSDDRHSQDEIRLHAVGRTDDNRFLHVTFTLRGGGRLIRVISARTMHRKERIRYEQEA